MLGQTISHYKILEKLGEGGMGVVYKAQDLKLNRFVALKFLPESLRASSGELARFQQEADAIASLSHPHVASVIDVDEVNGQKFLVLEYLPGGTLKSNIKHLQSSGKELPLTEVIDYGLQIAEGLAHAHRHGIVHRDVKTDNVMLTEEGKVKITDFGLAKLHGAAPLTKTGSTLGTVSYMSPEQIRGEALDHRSDLFSFGIVLYELATGHLPFRGEHEAAISYSIVNEDPIPLKSLRPGLPSSLESIIMRSLERQREKRFQSAEEIVTEFRKLQQEISGYTGASRKRSKFWWTIAATFGVLLFIVLYFFISSRPAPDESKSIAVLPFVNMSADKEDEYFSDGITEELINALSKLEGLHVAARTSSFVFKGKTEDISKIGQQLHVSTVLEGSVRKAGNKLRITAQLINVDDGFHLWSETYEREMQDVFAIQDEISRTIVGTLKIRLVGEQSIRLAKRYTDNLEAYNLYLLGRFQWNKRTGEGLLRAIEYFIRAIEYDSSYALAYTGLADCYSLLPWYGEWSPKEAAPKARAAALKAIALDSTFGEAYTSIAAVENWYDWDWTSAERDCQRSIQFSPNYATGHHWYGTFLASRGRFDEAARELKRALELDPLSLIINVNYADVLYYAGRYDEALEGYKRAIDISSSFRYLHEALGKTYLQKGMYEQALEEFRKGEGGEITRAYVALGRREEAVAFLRNLEERATYEWVNPVYLAQAYLGLGEKDRAFQWLEKAYQQRSPWLVEGLKVDPYFRTLHDDPRFGELLKKVGLDK